MSAQPAPTQDPFEETQEIEDTPILDGTYRLRSGFEGRAKFFGDAALSERYQVQATQLLRRQAT